MPLSRRRTRRYTLQNLYAQWAYESPVDTKEFIAQFEEEETFLDEPYFDQATTYIIDNLPYLLGIIQHFGPKFEVKSLPMVNLLILLIALFELLSGAFDDIPPNVAINEALELAKKYSDTGSKNFINGVLNSVLQNLEALKNKTYTITEIPLDIFHS